MKRKSAYKTIAEITGLLLMLTLLCGCAGQERAEAEVEPSPAIDIVSQPEPVLTPEPDIHVETVELSEAEPETEPGSGRQDGERFEDTIFLEGMEEKVRYEHVKNDEIGIEMDYEYETLERQKDRDKEIFVSIYDDPDNPQNYLEVTHIAENADTVSASVCDTLSKGYDISREPFTLDQAGSCTRIDAYNGKGSGGASDLLQTVYIIPTGDDCIVATANCTIESAEGFGSRFAYMVNTMTIIDKHEGE